MQFTGHAKTQDPSLQHDWVITCGINYNLESLCSRCGGQMLALRFAAVPRRLAVDLANPPHQARRATFHQPGVIGQHPDISEHVAQPLSRIRRTEEELLLDLTRDLELPPERLWWHGDRVAQQPHGQWVIQRDPEPLPVSQLRQP